MKTIDLTGTWDAQITATGGTQFPIGSQWTAVITLVQTGSTVSGTYVRGYRLSGEVSGSVSGDEVSMTINQGPTCPGTFHGAAKVNALSNQIIGTYSGSDSDGTLQASFTALKKKHYIVVLRGWWLEISEIIANIIIGILVITSLLAAPLSATAAVLFLIHGYLIMFLCSAANILVSLVSLLFVSTFSMNLSAANVPLIRNVIFVKAAVARVLFITFVNTFAIYLFFYALGIRLSWWS